MTTSALLPLFSFLKMHSSSLFKAAAILFVIIGLPSCVSPVKQTCIIDSSIAATMAKSAPVQALPIKVYVSGDVSWAGKPAPIANGYFKQRLKNVFKTIPGYTLTSKSSADLVIHVKRNNKFMRKEMMEKAIKVAKRQSLCETSPNLYDHIFKITGPKGVWEGNVPHKIMFVYGDIKYASDIGQSFKGAEEGNFLEISDLVMADEAMLSQVVIHALSQAHASGIF